ncbi:MULTISPECIES: penicillin-binding protein activator [unclassified Acidisoma]|uniref:penicillin-binding protein activator n=1 Tax=unclassified Acidisoma TaxID=2634065 RepID=UPI00131C6C93|nr:MULTISPECIES: penicillin-binding protein activator [unclassified Acidisoma]
MKLTRTLTLLTSLFGLSACVQPNTGSNATGGGTPQALGAGGASSSARRIAILVPLSGANGGVGASLVNAAKLGLGLTQGSTLDVIDTGSTPQGAAIAVKKAVADGAGLIIGPLTASETAAVAAPAQAARIDVLAFTSDSTQARPGVWTLGITPAQQVHALVQASEASGHSHFAGLLPTTPLGMALGEALRQEAVRAGSPSPNIQTYGGSFASMDAAVRALSDYAGRRGPIDAQAKQLRLSHTPGARSAATKLEGQGVPPPPFDAVLVAVTGASLSELATLLPYYDVSYSQVRILGPGLWAANPGAVASAGFSGALYAAPDPAASATFVSTYTQANGGPPSPLAALAFDAGAIARVATAGGSVDQSALTNPAGFAGADGVLALQPDGQVRRGLAVFQVGSGGAQIVQPAPQSLASPGS